MAALQHGGGGGGGVMAQNMAGAPAQGAPARGAFATPADYISLMKPRVMSLVIFTGLIGMLASPGLTATHPVLLTISLAAIAAGAGASGAINQWYDRGPDALMARTRTRPLPQGRIAPDEALALGLVVSVLSVLVLGLSGGIAAAMLLAFTIFFYGVVYTIWLKRRTPQNIVIGGAAGAFPPVIGWLAAGGDVFTATPLILFAIIFVWTPPHFWALALVRKDEYKAAGIPMLPVVAGRRATARQIVIYSVVLAGLAPLPSFLGLAGLAYGVFAALLSGVFILKAVRLLVSDSDTDAMRLFGYSIMYLFAVFLAFGVDCLVRLG